jgi:hypothetical protein
MQGKKQTVNIHMTGESFLSWFCAYKGIAFEYYHYEFGFKNLE